MAEKYKCLNPLGIQAPVDLHPLAPRIDTIDGKTIYVCINAGGDQDITIPLLKQLPADYPNVNWTQKKTYAPSPIQLTEEEMKTTDAMILAVCW